jgi:hypothetical protein
MVTGRGGTGVRETMLVVVTTNSADTADVIAWLGPQHFDDDVIVASGFYAGVAALAGGWRAVVLDVGAPDSRDSWRLAELRHRAGEATYVVVTDATELAQLAGALQTDLAVTSVSRLPPVREMLVSEESLVGDQTSCRRAMR